MVGGRVVGDSTHHPLAGVLVRLVDSASTQVVDSATTDSAGIFYTTAPKPGTYSLLLTRANAAPRATSNWTLGSPEAFQQGTFTLPEGAEAAAYTEAQVDVRVGTVPGNPGPRYPTSLRAKGTPGNVRIRFIVDTTGRIVPGSLRILFASHPDFAAAVEAIASQWKFVPAMRNGVPVAQIACMPMTFRVDFGKAKQLDAQFDDWVKHPGCPRD